MPFWYIFAKRWYHLFKYLKPNAWYHAPIQVDDFTYWNKYKCHLFLLSKWYHQFTFYTTWNNKWSIYNAKLIVYLKFEFNTIFSFPWIYHEMIMIVFLALNFYEDDLNIWFHLSHSGDILLWVCIHCRALSVFSPALCVNIFSLRTIELILTKFGR